MVHFRLNQAESNPNPHINFITALPASTPEDAEAARQLLRALAAQVRPVMKSHGFVINSFEEYEHNSVFAGRNWNSGETVELVLRRQDGLFLPTYWLMSTLCHELAHIKYMNHGPAFQALWKQLRVEVRVLQDKGYYGDGYWSSGQRLIDSARVSGDGIDPGDLPEFMCGGAQSRARPSSIRRRRPITSNDTTGRQTKKRKAGTRVTAKNAFLGQGATLAESFSDVSGTRTRINSNGSKRAREERALAAEKRLKALQDKSKPNASTSTSSKQNDDEVEIIHETDAERRQILLNSGEQDTDLQGLRLDKSTSWKEFQREFNFGHKATQSNDPGCNLPVASVSTYTTSSNSSATLNPSSSMKNKHSGTSQINLSNIVQTEKNHRKKEALGLTPTGHGGRTMDDDDDDDDIIVSNPSSLPGSSMHSKTATKQKAKSKVPSEAKSQWECLVCTLLNEPNHLACSACGTTRGENTWTPRP
ncbi:hypothetical protein AMATHDRAFT_73782 [Amanita thiersii Skay4041]|uniref:WLM domain-containing protein n=1 Tax=Amanita thiersii Skay4041 TaxID=703135 RepID=A0A2A9NX58_9AGAR|nr:hypothetical protein AMATHDRAFT_73782 [Amanita thiersii Skay4041]